jgi:FAD/FMN-containing dehydrogenase
LDSERLARLEEELRGLELRLDPESRERYSRDRSPFRRLPAAVLEVRSAEELADAVAAASSLAIPVTARAGGSSVAGQCLGTGLIVDVCGLRGIEPAGRGGGEWDEVWCAAGERLDDVNAVLAARGRAIGPDAVSSRWARIGGLVATNACAARSLRYGRFADALLGAEVVLADGTIAKLGPGEVPEAAGSGLAAARSGLEADLTDWPRQPREPGGYRLPELAARGDALSLLPGSEGTLCLLTRARLATVPAPARRSLVLASFRSLRSALDAAADLAESGASAVELLDARLVAAAREAGLDPLAPGAAAALLVERLDDVPSGIPRVARGESSALEGEEAELAWALRGRALELAGGDGRTATGADSLALACFEDPAVAPERAGGFCDELLRLLRRFGFEAIVYGHAAAGCLHVRPLCDPADPHLGDRLLDAAEAVCDLVGEWQGAFTGEHGWGLSRSHLARRALGDPLYARCEAVKRAFDPEGVMNPGMVVGGNDPRALVEV